jgi:hypothetical protein
MATALSFAGMNPFSYCRNDPLYINVFITIVKENIGDSQIFNLRNVTCNISHVYNSFSQSLRVGRSPLPPLAPFLLNDAVRNDPARYI